MPETLEDILAKISSLKKPEQIWKIITFINHLQVYWKMLICVDTSGVKG